MAEEYTAGPGRDGACIGRGIATEGSQEISEDPTGQDLRAAAAENGDKGPDLTSAIEMCGDGKKTEDPAARIEPAGSNFYKSQEEVDRAFGKRLASERRRWEREHREELRKARSGQEEKNLDDADTWLPQQQMYAREYTYFADLVTQADALAEDCPEFDLLEELKGNAAFEKMVTSGMPVAEAYGAVGQALQIQKEQSIRQDERNRVLDEMESRTQCLPPVDRDPGLSSPALDVTRLSEEELVRLAERVRKGERVVI